jgi:hypothetical protein
LKGRYILVPSDPPASAALGRRSTRRDGLAIVEIAWVLEHQPQQVLAARFDLISRLVESAVAKAGGVLLTQKVTVSATAAANLAHPHPSARPPLIPWQCLAWGESRQSGLGQQVFRLGF